MRPSLLLLVAAAAALCYAATAAAVITGGWHPIQNTTDPHIQEIGEWAVVEHVKRANDGLRFQKVVGGEVQVVAGLNYRLDIEAVRVGGMIGKYKAAVFEQAWPSTQRELLSFERAN